MDIIARFPRLPAEAVAGERQTRGPDFSSHPVDHRLSKRSPRQPVFPGLSVAVLAVLAAVVWSLAAWNDNLRLARQQRPERLAARPAPTQPASP